MKNKSFVILIATILFFVLLPLLIPFGIRVATDFPLISQDFIKLGFSPPSAWKVDSAEGMGQFGGGTLWSWPLSFVFGLLGTLGLGYMGVVLVGLIFPTLILGAYSINKFLKIFEVGLEGRLVGGLFYLTNTYFILLLDGGQLSIALAYSIFPLVFLALIYALTGGLKSKLIAALAVSFLGAIDIRVVYMLAVLAIFWCIYEFLFKATNRTKYIISCVVTAVLIIAFYLGLNAYWIIPVLLTKSDLVPPSYKLVPGGVVQFYNSLTVLQPGWYTNVFGKVSPKRIEFLIIPFLAFIAPFLNHKLKNIYFWVAVGVLSIFLVIGANPPFGVIYSWLYNHIPGFVVFKDSTKFFFLLNLSYSILIGGTIKKLTRFFKYTPFLVGTIFIILISPVFLGKMTGMFSPPICQREFSNLNRILESDNNWGRVLWLPSRAPLGYASVQHTFLEGLRLIALRPFAATTIGKYEIFNFLRESPFMGELFDIAGIRYIVYPFPDTRRETLKPDNIDYYNAFSDQLAHLPWIESKISDYPINAFKTKNTQDHFFLATKIFNIVGSDYIYNDLINIDGFSLHNNALVFAEEKPEILNDISSAKIILFNKNMIDLTASIVSVNNFIYPAENLPNDPVSEKDGLASRCEAHEVCFSAGWWKRTTSDFVWWRDFLQTKYNLDNQDLDYGGGYSIAEGNRELQISNNQFQIGNKLVARVMTSSRGGKMEFWQGNTLIGEIDTKLETPEKIQVKLTGYKDVSDQVLEYDKAELNWFMIGDLVKDEELTIKTSGDINVVNVLISVTSGEWERLQQKVLKYKEEGKIIDWRGMKNDEKKILFKSHNNSSVSYSRISPTHYKVKITNLDSPATLVFSETFDSNWTLNNQNSIKLYSLVNGFNVDKDGEYDVYYSPQKYVLMGVGISIFSLAVLGGYFLYTFINAKKD